MSQSPLGAIANFHEAKAAWHCQEWGDAADLEECQALARVSRLCRDALYLDQRCTASSQLTGRSQ